MNESQMWDTLRDQFKKMDIFAKRVTEKSVGGLPDIVAVDHKGRVAWIELKVAKIRPKSPPAINYRADQALWLYEWTKHWGKGGLLVRVLNPQDEDKYWYFKAQPSIEWVKCWPNPRWEDLEKYPPKEYSAHNPLYELREEIFG